MLEFIVRALTPKRKGKGSKTVAIKDAGAEFFNGEERTITNPKTGQSTKRKVRNGILSFGRRTLGVKPGDKVIVS